jgi:hypothetical protein
MNSKLITTIALIGSLLIHAAFLFVLTSTAGLKPPPPPPKEKERDSLKVELISAAPPSVAKQLKPGDKGYVRDEQMCEGKDNTYTGVGIMIQPGSDTVIKAPEQYPAYRAGMRVGDFIIDPFGVDIVDGYMTFKIMRHTEIMEFHIKVENICYKKSG